MIPQALNKSNSGEVDDLHFDYPPGSSHAALRVNSFSGASSKDCEPSRTHRRALLQRGRSRKKKLEKEASEELHVSPSVCVFGVPPGRLAGLSLVRCSSAGRGERITSTRRFSSPPSAMTAACGFD
ncbi:unnamed protein product [Lota lota]